jgi:predicted PurR-regulated permease PerM
MTSEEYLNFSTGEKKLLRFTLVTLSAVTLMGLIVFVVWILGKILSILYTLILPLTITSILALILSPVVEFFERHLRLSRLMAVVTLFLLLFLLLVAALVLVVPAVISQSTQFVNSMPIMVERGYEKFSLKYPIAVPVLEDTIAEIDFQALIPKVANNELWAFLLEKTKAYLGIVVGMAFVPLYLFFTLLAGYRIRESAKELLSIFGYRTQHEVLYLGQIFIGYVTAFFRGQLTIALIMGLIMAVGFTTIGLQGAIFFGLALGMLNIVPFLGFLVGLVTVLPVAYIQPDGGIQLIALVMGVILLTQMIEGFLLTPKIMADRSGLPPALVVISVFFWGIVLGGVVGMILAVPLTAFFLALWKHMKARFAAAASLRKSQQDSS